MSTAIARTTRSKIVAQGRTKTKNTSLKTSLTHLPTRARLVLAATTIGVLTVIVSSRLMDVYDSAYQQFELIVQQYSVRVDAAEQAMQHVAAVDTSAADFSDAAPNSQVYQTALASIYSEFAQFRDNMYVLRGDLSTDEQPLYTSVEQAVYNQFWPDVGVVVADVQNGDSKGALAAYLKVDNSLGHDVTNSLHQLEAANFSAMVNAQQQAGGLINTEAIVLVVLLLALALVLTGLSFWVRMTVRRLITPGIDAAAVVAWLVVISVFGQMFALPEALRTMVQDAYYSVTASSRVLDIANQGNRDESGALLDLTHAGLWQQDFDITHTEVELRLCGQPGCLSFPFTVSGDTLNPNVYANAKAINTANLAAIGGIVPLVANVTYAGEAETLETARWAYLDYLKIDGEMRQLIKNNQIAQALVINTGTQPGQSDEAYGRFTKAMEQEKQINRAAFDQIWQTEQDALPNSRVVYGVVCGVLVIVLLAFGTYHRVREL